MSETPEQTHAQMQQAQLLELLRQTLTAMDRLQVDTREAIKITNDHVTSCNTLQAAANDWRRSMSQAMAEMAKKIGKTRKKQKHLDKELHQQQQHLTKLLQRVQAGVIVLLLTVLGWAGSQVIHIKQDMGSSTSVSTTTTHSSGGP